MPTELENDKGYCMTHEEIIKLIGATEAGAPVVIFDSNEGIYLDIKSVQIEEVPSVHDDLPAVTSVVITTRS